jgi:FkbM family methyltransferase
MSAPALDYRSDGWRAAFPVPPLGLGTRPLALFAPYSYLGTIFGPMIVERCPQVVAVVDDHYQDARIHGIERWSSDEFRARAVEHPGIVAIDMSYSPLGHAVFAALAQDTGITMVDVVRAIGELDLPAIYQTPAVMRERTLAREREWSGLRDALADDWSRRTLDAALELRLTMDRRPLRPVVASLEDEYFSVLASATTFKLGTDEIVADCGAYIGSTVRKAIAATDGRFRAIHAFEPDRKSFTELEKLRALRMPNIVLHNAALGDQSGNIGFLETGTMGSHVDESSVGDTPLVRLDDTMDEVTFIKMDLEGYEQKALRGAARLLRECRPRMAITAYHYADDLLDLWKLFDELVPDYELRLRHHSSYYYDTIFYASPRERARTASPGA